VMMIHSARLKKALQVVLGLERMKKHKAPGLSGIVTQMLQAMAKNWS